MKDQKRKRISILVIAGVLMMLAMIVGFFWHASRVKALPPKIFAQISEFQALANLETAQKAPQDRNLAGLTPAEAYTAVCAGEDGESCTIYAYVFQNETDATTYFKRVSGRDVSETGVSFLAPFRSGCHQNLCIARSTMCALFTSQEVHFPNSIRLRMKFLPGYQ